MENERGTNVVPGGLHKHLVECSDCRNYQRFVAALNLQNRSLEKAPEDLLPAIEKQRAFFNIQTPVETHFCRFLLGTGGRSDLRMPGR